MSTVGELRQQRLQQTVQEAVQKQRQGKKLSPRELRALEEFELQQDERRGLRFVQAVPKKHWVTWSGRQHRTLNSQAELYGIPLAGPEVNVPAVVKWLHDFLATHKAVLSDLVKNDGDRDPVAATLQGRLLVQKIEQLQKRNALLADQIEQNRQQLLPRETVRALLVRCAGLLRSAGERLYKRHGNEAGDILANALEDFERTLSNLETLDETALADSLE